MLLSESRIIHLQAVLVHDYIIYLTRSGTTQHLASPLPSTLDVRNVHRIGWTYFSNAIFFRFRVCSFKFRGTAAPARIVHVCVDLGYGSLYGSLSAGTASIGAQCSSINTAQ